MNTMTYKGYQGKFEYDQESDIFMGKSCTSTTWLHPGPFR